MFFLTVDGDKFPNQRTWPVVRRNVGADTGTLEADLATIAQSPVNVVVAGHQDRVLATRAGVDQGLGVLQVLQGCEGLVF